MYSVYNYSGGNGIHTYVCHEKYIYEKYNYVGILLIAFEMCDSVACNTHNVCNTCIFLCSMPYNYYNTFVYSVHDIAILISTCTNNIHDNHAQTNKYIVPQL